MSEGRRLYRIETTYGEGIDISIVTDLTVFLCSLPPITGELKGSGLTLPSIDTVDGGGSSF